MLRIFLYLFVKVTQSRYDYFKVSSILVALKIVACRRVTD